MLLKTLHWLDSAWLSPWRQRRAQAQLLRFCPPFAPILQSFQAHYPDAGSAGLVSFLERQDRQWESDSLTYGETPFSTWIALLKHWQLGPEHTLIDLGGGSGLFSLLAHTYGGARAISIDCIEAFAIRGRDISSKHQLTGVEFVYGDFCELDLSQGSHFYSTLTCYPEELRQTLAAQFTQVSSGASIATVTFELDSPVLVTEHHWKHLFPWGWDDIFIQRRV